MEYPLIETALEAALHENESLYSGIFNAAYDAIFVETMDGRIIDANPAACEMLGYTREELLQMNVAQLLPPEISKSAKEILQQEIVTGGISFVGDNVRKDGSRIPVEVRTQLLFLNGKQYVVVIARDITERKRYEEQIRYQAYHDALTGLPNRRLFLDRLTMALAQAHRQRQLVAVMFLDLDNLKQVNDNLGHDIGDLLLVAVAKRLTGCVRRGDTVARMGGDEFLLVLPQLQNQEDANCIAVKLLAAIQEPFRVDGHWLHVTASIGISLYPIDGTDVQTLMKKADMAMYRAKELGRNNFQGVK